MTPDYPENTAVFVLMTTKGQFACLREMNTAKQWAYAFTTEQKAKDFIQILGKNKTLKNVNRLLPCTLKEWSGWQTKKGFPDLTIDIDPLKLRNYNGLIEADNIQFISPDSRRN